MAITNIALAKHKDGRAVSLADIKVGLEVLFKRGSGVIRHKCTSISSSKAEFSSINKNWPSEIVMELDHPEFTLADFNQLASALSSFSKWNTLPTDLERAIVYRAQTLGYAFSLSYSQAEWTDLGVETYHNIMTVKENEASFFYL